MFYIEHTSWLKVIDKMGVYFLQHTIEDVFSFGSAGRLLLIRAHRSLMYKMVG